MSSFDIVLKTAASLHPGGEPDRFISEHAGVIRRTRDRDGRVFSFARAPAGWAPRHAGEDGEREARRMGFRRVGRTRYGALSLSQVTPTLEEIVRPGR